METRWPFVLFVASAAVGCASSTPPAVCAPAVPGAPAAGTSAAGAVPDDLDHQTSEQLARRLMDLTGAGNLGKQLAANVAESMKKLPNMPPGFTDRFMANVHPEELTDLVVPIYVKELDHDTLVAVVRFYESPSGKLLASKLPAMTQASAEAGRAWGLSVAKKTLADMGVASPKGQ